ncbi:uncharacterized protein LOC110024655 [Phalaenopsis equestris]|uniref:uncharacterized protein LOC110024655 n=1 Tax=Phalaenopsis equestris TaxID=78828 RepID=UPI0009E3C570|nr:uncharacterized protein LOC110024655 [Phalaenopsis equestris]
MIAMLQSGLLLWPCSATPGYASCKQFCHNKASVFSRKIALVFSKRHSVSEIAKCSSSSSSGGSSDDSNGYSNKDKVPFGYTRKDVILIGVGLTVIGVGLKSGLEFAGVDPLQAGNVVQLVLVLGLTVGWIFTYIFRVSNKDMTYAQQLRDYENKVMEKRLESLSEADLEALLEQVEEEKRRLGSNAEQG